jgi:hypothetical protein
VTGHHQAPGRCRLGIVRIVAQSGSRGPGPGNVEDREDVGVAAKEEHSDFAATGILCLESRSALSLAGAQKDRRNPLSVIR